MKKFIELVKKYKLYILSFLLLFFFFRSCSKSTQIKKLDKQVNNNGIVVDSLENEIKVRQQKIDSLPEIMRIEKINIHLEYDEWISSKDRGQQLMELHSIVKNNVKNLQKK
jgi:PBP1b-binding outer membrane lipoprotein LpoB